MAMFPVQMGSAPDQMQSALAQIQAAGMLKKQLTEQENRLQMQLKSIEQRQADSQRSAHVLHLFQAASTALINNDPDAAMAILSMYGEGLDITPQQLGIPEDAVQRAAQQPTRPPIGAGEPTAPAIGGGAGQPAPETLLLPPGQAPSPETMPLPAGTVPPPVTLPGTEPAAEAGQVQFPYRKSAEAYRRPSEEYLGKMREAKKAKARGRGGAGSNTALRFWTAMRTAKTAVDKMIPAIRSGITRKEIRSAQNAAGSPEEKRMWGMMMAFGRDIKSIEDKDKAITFLQKEADKLNEQMEHLQETQFQGMFPGRTSEEAYGAEVDKLIGDLDRRAEEIERGGRK